MMDLYPFQKDGVRFLHDRRRAYLADVMGLGKTVQAARAAEQIGAERVLVICPASLRENWRREWLTWNRYNGCELRVHSYASRPVRTGEASGWADLVVLDEAHYCKNPRAKRTLNALSIALASPRSWLLSGTPMPNHPGELWPPIRALWPEIPERLGLRSYDAWYRFFCRYTITKYGRRPYGVKNQRKLRPFLTAIMLRRTLDDVGLELPPIRVHAQLLPEDPEFERQLEEVDVDPDNLRRLIEWEEAADDGSLSRLRRLVGEYKAPRIGALLADELRDQEYRKVVVLAYHHSVLDLLHVKLAPFGVVGFRGATSGTQRQEAIDMFTRDPDTRVFLAQQGAAREGNNLQVASEIVLVEPDWTPAMNAQAIKRIHRIGQDSPCRARLFGVAGSVDQAIIDTMAKKIRMQESLGLN